MSEEIFNNKLICEKQNCTGCMACKQICPHNAIEIIMDNNGFEYPVRTEECVQCGLCTKICPSLSDTLNEEKFSQIVFACRSKNKDVILKSASGGAFTTIVQAYCDNNYAIFGVEYDETCSPHHSYVLDKKLIDKYRKSKYVQSSVGNSYKDAKKMLEEGRKVLFTGTPCQIAGLKNFLNKEYDNLLTVDIVCHGVPNKQTLKKYLQYMEDKYKSKVKAISFREKIYKNKEWDSKCIKIEFENNKTIIENIRKNLFLRGFHSQLFYRESCYNCKYANPKRISDITIADCWGIGHIYPDWNVHEGVSMVVINSEKGQKLLPTFEKECECLKLDIEFAKKENARFREPTKMNPKREFFFSNIDNMRFDKLINKCVPQKRMRHIIGRLIPKNIKKIIGGKLNGKKI